jgi:hypothetical protein
LFRPLKRFRSPLYDCGRELLYLTMGKEHVKDLLKFLKPFPKVVQETALWLRDFVWDLYPAANELIYDNYNAVAFGWSVTEKLSHTFCSVAIWRTNQKVIFGFYWGNEIADPKKILIGNGNQFRYLPVPDKQSFPKAYITKLIKEAYANSYVKVKDQKLFEIQGQTFMKSISPVKRAAPSKAKEKVEAKKKVVVKKKVSAKKK